ncbi:MAG: hypothetical protein V1754_06180 [Pseudomonadota bacterium]
MNRPKRAFFVSGSQGWTEQVPREFLGWFFIFGGIVLSLFVTPAHAMDLNRLRSELADLEQMAKTLTVKYQVQAASQEQLAEHRLVDAEILFSLKDYTRAAILLFDYVQKYKDTPGYPEALFHLADSLYHKRDFLSARRYFQIIIDRGQGEYYQEALQRLIELSLQTGDTTDVPKYLDALSNIPAHMVQSSAHYVRGKYYFFQRANRRCNDRFQDHSARRTLLHARPILRGRRTCTQERVCNR